MLIGNQSIQSFGGGGGGWLLAISFINICICHGLVGWALFCLISTRGWGGGGGGKFLRGRKWGQLLLGLLMKLLGLMANNGIFSVWHCFWDSMIFMNAVHMTALSTVDLCQEIILGTDRLLSTPPICTCNRSRIFPRSESVCTHV